MRRGRLFFALLCCVMLTGCREIILHDLEEEQANRVWVHLKFHQFHPEKERSGSSWAISVPKGESYPALSVLEKVRLPRRVRKREERGGALIAGRGEREANRERELSERLEETLSVLPGVVEARVHLLLRNDERSGTPSASVLLLTLPEVKVEPQQIRELVAGAGAFKADQVTVAVASLPPVGLKEGGA